MKSKVWWVGNSPHWVPMLRPYKSEYIVPLVEELVLDVAFGGYDQYKRLSKRCAVNCTSRVAQRVALASTGLNPAWTVYQWEPGVIKAPASCGNNGVRFFNNTEHMELLEEFVPELARLGVMEEFVEGDAYEIDGACKDDVPTFFHPLSQMWNEDRTLIQGYKRIETPIGMLEAATKAIHALGINNSCFCIEFRKTDNGWRVIDAHARLGEDHGLAAIMWDEYPLRAAEKVFLSH